MSISVVVSSTAAGVSVSGGTAVSIEVGGGIGPAGFVVAPGTATNAFGTFQLAAGDGITISTSASQFTISSYGTAAVSSLAPVQSVAGRVGAIQLQAADVTAGTFDIARIPTISYTALANVPATFSPSAHTHSTSDVVSFTAAAAAAAPVQSVAGRQGAISLAAADVSGLAAVASSGSYTSLQNVPATFAPAAHTHGTADIVGISGSFASADHTHDAAAISSGVLDLARIPTIGYTALSGVPSTFAPQAHAHDYVQALNGLTGTVSITGGAGVTVSTASSSITIAAAGSYVLPTATGSVLGGIKVGSGLTITDGVLAASGGGGGGEDTTLRAFFVPPAPTSLTASGGNAQVSLSWTAPTVLAQTPITDYVVQFSSNSGSTWTTFSDGTSTATSATVTGLTNGTAYVFRLAAVNGVGQGAYTSATSSVTPDAPTTAEIEYLIVAGGGGGGFNEGGGGGAGGLVYYQSQAVPRGQALSIAVGAGGAGATSNHSVAAASGSNSTFYLESALGGGGGGGALSNGANGGSGGGCGSVAQNGGSGFPGQGSNGGNRNGPATGGGGAGEVGQNQATGSGSAGRGGNGLAHSILGGSVYRAGGGGGGWQYPSSGGLGGGGGGGGNTANFPATASNGTQGLGGGGGGGGSNDGNGGNGGAGIVIIRTAATAVATTGNPSVTTEDGENVYVFGGSGSITF